MKKILLLNLTLLCAITFSSAQNSSLEPFPCDSAWIGKIFELAPKAPLAPVPKKHKILLFSLFTGFEHWVIPHADAVMFVLAEKTGAFEIVRSTDISVFEKKNLKKFDAVVLNNNCSVGDRRDLFYDALSAEDSTLSEQQKVKTAAKLESNLLSFVKKGGGLIAIHGGIVMQNNSPEFSQMLGGSFDYHPHQQELTLKIADKSHPITQIFDGQAFIHIDEPYFFKNAYRDKNFKPLLYMEISQIDGVRHETKDTKAYVSWIKSYGKGRVFYSSPSHNGQSYENEELLLFYLNGIQYALGDLECDDTPGL